LLQVRDGGMNQANATAGFFLHHVGIKEDPIIRGTQCALSVLIGSRGDT